MEYSPPIDPVRRKRYDGKHVLAVGDHESQ
jgi:hypothetical protein